MEKFNELSLGELFDSVTGGGTPSRGVAEYWNGNISWASVKDFTDDTIALEETKESITELGLQNSASKLINAGTPIICLRMAVGRAAIAKSDVSINQDLKALFTKEEVDSAYLIYLLCFVRSDIEGRSIGSTVKGISTSELLKVRVPFPSSIDVQKKISFILNTVDKLIEKTQSLIDKYTAIKQGMMADLFTRGIDLNNGPDGTPASNPNYGKLRPSFEETPEFYKETELGWVPKEWDVQYLINLLADIPSAMRSGPFGSALLKHELVEKGIPLLGIDNIFVERFVPKYHRFLTQKKFGELSRYAVRPNDVVITIMGTVGRCCIVPSNVGIALSSKHLWTMSFDNERVLSELICWQLNYAPWVRSWFYRKSQGGVMEAIQSATLKSLKLPVPRIKEQKHISKIYKNLSEKITKEKTYLDKLTLQKKGLMQDLLTGKVKVN